MVIRQPEEKAYSTYIVLEYRYLYIIINGGNV
jgi:hypothetical protein